jgi:hypothetical protein
MIRRSLKLATALLLLASVPASAGADREGEVRAVSLVPAAGRAELVIHIEGAVDVTDQILRDPNRIVLDVTGAHLSPGADRFAYDGVKRAGVRNLRVRQFAPGVVRIVLDMDQAVQYRVERTPDAIRVTFGSDAGFLAWSSGTIEPLRAALADDAVAVEAKPATQPAPRGRPWRRGAPARLRRPVRSRGSR